MGRAHKKVPPGNPAALGSCFDLGRLLARGVRIHVGIRVRASGVGSAQVLLTHADLADRERYLNARSTLLTLLSLGVIPVINENDTVVNDEIKFGDNDTLGALVANLVDADVLVILTDQKGLYSADPRRDPSAEFVHFARAGDPALDGSR